MGAVVVVVVHNVNHVFILSRHTPPFVWLKLVQQSHWIIPCSEAGYNAPSRSFFKPRSSSTLTRKFVREEFHILLNRAFELCFALNMSIKMS